MRNKILPLLLLTSIVLSSCATTTYYQVYKAVPDDNIIQENDFLIYEDENCEIVYNLWNNGGNIGFIFQNNSDENIYLNMEESFFIQNGIAHNYYKNRVFTTSESAGVSLSTGSSVADYDTDDIYGYFVRANRLSASNLLSSQTSVSFSEEKFICIPSNSAKIIAEYSINRDVIRDCDLLRFPNKEKDINTLRFYKENSPIVFSNRLTYTVGYSPKPIHITNEFYVSEITNYPRNEIVNSTNEEYCGQKSTVTTYVMKNFSPSHFYLMYNKEDTFWEH